MMMSSRFPHFGKNTAVLLVAVAILHSACVTTPDVDGSGQTSSETRPYKDIDRVEVTGEITVNFSNGKGSGITVTAETNVMPYVKTERDGDTLKISTNCKCDLNPSLPITIDMQIGGIEVIVASDDTHVNLGTVKVDELKLVLSSKSKTQIKGIKASEIQVEASDQSTVTIVGSTDELVIEAEDEANIDAKELVAEEAEIKAQDHTSISLRVSDDLDAQISDAATLKLANEAKKSQIKRTGNAQVVRQY